MKISSIHLENIRSLGGEQEIKIAPLTFLTGDPNTGKSTVMDVFFATRDLFGARRTVALSNHSYPTINFGNFARMEDGEYVDSFMVGATVKGKKADLTIKKYYDQDVSHTKAAAVTLEFSSGGSVVFADNKYQATARTGMDGIGMYTGINDKGDHIIRCDVSVTPDYVFKEFLFGNINFSHANFKGFSSFWENKCEDINDIIKSLSIPNTAWESLPQDKMSDFCRDIENLNFKEKKTDRLIKAIKYHGQRAGVFDDFYIKKDNQGICRAFIVSNGKSDPLILAGDTTATALHFIFNIVQSHSGKPTPVFWVKNPENSMNPKAQAEISSMLSYTKSVAMIETNSDYMISRARAEISFGNISNDMVSLVFMKSDNDNRNIACNLSLNQKGEIVTPPYDYRRWFSEEKARISGEGVLEEIPTFATKKELSKGR